MCHVASHEKEIMPPYKLILAATSLATVIQSCFFGHPNTDKADRWVKWNQNLANGFIINVDGSYFGDLGRVGFGGVIRNQDGGWVLGFAGSIGVSEILHVEISALYYGLQYVLGTWVYNSSGYLF